MPALVSAKLIKPLGNPPQNGVKFFATREVLELSRDDKWLHRATSAIHLHWHSRNARKAKPQGGETAPEAEVTLLAKQLTGKNSHSKVAYGTEGGLFQLAGIPTVVCGPGNIDQAHKADEFIRITELEKCGNFIDRLIAHCTR